MDMKLMSVVVTPLLDCAYHHVNLGKTKNPLAVRRFPIQLGAEDEPIGLPLANFCVLPPQYFFRESQCEFGSIIVLPHVMIVSGTRNAGLLRAQWTALSRIALLNARMYFIELEVKQGMDTQGKRIWNFLDIRAAEKSRACLNLASDSVNLLAHCPQKRKFPRREAGRCRMNQLSGLKPVCEESKCVCPGWTPLLG
jgi:hypothetical protein